MKKMHPGSSASSNPGATSSVLSLIAITAGTVSVALVIMFAGLFLTMMSLGGNAQSTASLHNEARTMGVTLVAETASIANDQKTQARKAYFMDALLRNDGNGPSASSSDGHPQPSTIPARVYVISTTKSSLNHTYLIQI